MAEKRDNHQRGMSGNTTNIAYLSDDEHPRSDSFSLHSTSPLAPQGVHSLSYNYPPMPTPQTQPPPDGLPHLQARPKLVQQSTSGMTQASHAGSSSWDLLSGMRKFESDYEHFDSRNAKEKHLQFAEGDLPNNKFARLYNYLLNVSIVTRWFLFITPVMAILWIPGILGLTAYKNARIYNVKLLWWSVFLSVLWGGWWASLAAARVAPLLVRHTVGVVAVGARRYIDWLTVLHRYVAFFGWTIGVYVSFNPIINNNQEVGQHSAALSLVARLLFAFVILSSALLFEKFSIQWIAGKFHERSYAERIADQKASIRVLVTLYAHSSDIPGRGDTLRDPSGSARKGSVDATRFFKAALKGVKSTVKTTTTALGNVASEIAGSSVLQPNSPQAMVQAAIASANKTRLLARRLFYSFRTPGHDHLVLEDIARFFQTPEDAHHAFNLFDKDDNGDATREEVEMACLEVHREQISIEHSMRDLDSAVGRLDNIFMTVYVIVAILVLAVALEAQLATLITGAGTFILGLSWLIGGSLQEVLTSIIFLFIKHPYDVGDRITVEKDTYTVQEISLLSTVFVDGNGGLVQMPNDVLNAKAILNIRRSAQMSESFEFDVAYSTTFEQIETLRAKMLAFVKSEGRDFLPSFDVTVKDIPEQDKMTLSADIKYKSNWQQGAIKVRRRNKWICALKTSLAELKIFGPKGNPDKEAGAALYTQMPWDEFLVQKREDEVKQAAASFEKHIHTVDETKLPKTDYSLQDKNALLMSNNASAFGDDQGYSTPTAPPTRPGTSQAIRGPPPAPVPPMPLPNIPPTSSLAEEYEMKGSSYV